MRTSLALTLLLFASTVSAQSVTLPADTTASQGDLVPIDVKYVGDSIKIKVTKGLTTFRVYDPDATKYSLMLYVPPKAADGVYEITAIAATKAGVLSDFATCTVTVGGGPGPFDKSKVMVPDVVGKTPFQAYQALTAAGLLYTFDGDQTHAVAAQVPPAGTVVKKGECIKLTCPNKKGAMASPCSPACSCGCNSGGFCTCGHSSAAPVQRAVQIAPSGRRGGSC